MPIPLLMVILFVVALMVTTWILQGRVVKLTFMLGSSSLTALCFLSAWYAWAEPPQSIAWTTGWILGGLLTGILTFSRYQRP